MYSFKQFYNENNTAGSVFTNGAASVGETGNQFPANNDSGYAPGDYRTPHTLGVFTRNSLKLKNRKIGNKSLRHAQSPKTKRK